MAEWEESMSARGRESGDIETPSVACEAAAVAHERSEYFTAVEGGMVTSSTRSGDERRDYGVRLKQLQRRCGSEEELNTARSMATWTQVAGTSWCLSEGMSAAEKEECVSENRRFFEDLISKEPRLPKIQFLPSPYVLLELSPFFLYYRGRLEVGKKIGAGGQAEIYEALFDGKKALRWDDDYGDPGYVLKVFRLEHSEWFRQAWAQESHRIRMQSLKESPDSYRYCCIKNCTILEDAQESKRIHWQTFKVLADFRGCCFVQKCTILEDGRFAFLMRRYWGDLRKAIDGQILKDETHLRPPFPLPVSIYIMRSIAVGMIFLHGKGILHRDLKAANVLLRRDNDFHAVRGIFPDCYVADFESGDGVMGTGFWRAPEVLRILRSGAADKHSDPAVWTPKVDVYAYAMTCYEVLSGCIPFVNRPQNDYDIGDERPLLPDYVDEEIGELLRECWNSDPWKRPSFEVVCEKLDKYIVGKVIVSRALAKDERDEEAWQWLELA